jgi:glycine/D-amino acid oxidase-like deaminating enzyme
MALKQEPYWWEAAPRRLAVAEPLPARVDVAVVGAGYTGLSAALTLARAGRDVLLLEAGAIGSGASTRNAGFVGRTLKHSYAEIIEAMGEPKATAIYREMRVIFDFIIDLIRREGIDCHLKKCGRFIAALSPRHYEEMVRIWDLRSRKLGDLFEPVARADQHREVASDLYHGGLVIPDHHSLHPALYHQGLLERATKAGARAAGDTAVLAVARDGANLALLTSRGRLQAREVLIATNGYTGKATPQLRRRIVPFHGFMAATGPLPPGLLARVLPNRRIFHDSFNNLIYMRPAPDSERLLFGGLSGPPTRDLPAKARRLQEAMVRVLPDMRGIAFSHIWTGQCAATFDLYPHIGRIDGLHFAMGYCFGGVTMGTWLGHKSALRILGRPDARSVFDELTFPTRFYHRGAPWFLPLAARLFDWHDRRSL